MTLRCTRGKQMGLTDYNHADDYGTSFLILGVASESWLGILPFRICQGCIVFHTSASYSFPIYYLPIPDGFEIRVRCITTCSPVYYWISEEPEPCFLHVGPGRTSKPTRANHEYLNDLNDSLDYSFRDPQWNWLDTERQTNHCGLFHNPLPILSSGLPRAQSDIDLPIS